MVPAEGEVNGDSGHGNDPVLEMSSVGRKIAIFQTIVSRNKKKFKTIVANKVEYNKNNSKCLWFIY